MAEKIQINLSNDQKKSSDEQFLQAPRNWQKCSALDERYINESANNNNNNNNNNKVGSCVHSLLADKKSVSNCKHYSYHDIAPEFLVK
jgi:hypothetical protein